MSASNSNAPEKNTRIQSPSYPSMPLKEAVAATAKIEARYRTSAVDRSDAAKLMGYSGSTGPSNMALASLASYGLIDRAGKGEVRVTERARSIIHPLNDGERKLALREAALGPELFRNLRERFQDVLVPPEEGVVTYLNRQNFNPGAIRPAAKAFLQTMIYAQEQGVMESSGHAPETQQESASRTQGEELTAMQATTSTYEAMRVPPLQMATDLTLNEPNLSIRGGTVRVEALLDFEGLGELENQIKALKMILKPKRDTVTPAINDKPTEE